MIHIKDEPQGFPIFFYNLMVWKRIVKNYRKNPIQ